MQSHEIIEILGDVVKRISADCRIVMADYSGASVEIDCPNINYTFGNAQYVKDALDDLSFSPVTSLQKFPLIALFCPFSEDRGSVEYFTKAKVNILIACSTDKNWSNEQRLQASFKNILRPIYNRMLQALREDKRLDFGYEGVIPHKYSENYSYGKYGAYTPAGKEVSEPIDAINITDLELTVKNPTCR